MLIVGLALLAPAICGALLLILDVVPAPHRRPSGQGDARTSGPS
jgi:hypothetical protein